MADEREVRSAVDDARLALVQEIKAQTGKMAPTALKDLAEAYAWLTHPDGGH